MLLSKLMGPEVSAPAGAGEIEIAGISADSRTVAKGFVFAALPGTDTDGSYFVSQAVAAGASVVLIGRDVRLAAVQVDVPVLRADEPRRALALMAARFYEMQPANAVAVTGTSGKTSVVEFTRQILSALGHKSASLGTIGLVKPDGETYGALTTPDPVSLHKMLAELAREGVTHVAFEASSHGLAQHRLDGVSLKAGAFTNLGRDHLDYHTSIDAYLDAKLRLFRELLVPGQHAVINMDGAYSQVAFEAARARGLVCDTVGRKGETLRVEQVSIEGFNQRLLIGHRDGRDEVLLPLVGAYQVENALVAAGLAVAQGEAPGAVVSALGGLKGVKGRLDIVGRGRGGLAVVDYAHKPEALMAALDAVRPFVSGRLICVFGCGGDRDKGKRPIMGAIAADMSDVVIVTDDNPRTEAAGPIRAQILATCPGAREIGDRGEAIAAAVAMMGSGDVVLVAGKGHETGQIVGDKVLPFSDHEALLSALGELPSGA